MMARILFAIFALKLKHKLIRENTVKPRPNDRNISMQHCWVQHNARVWPPCCNILGVVHSHLTIYNTQHVATGWPNAQNVFCEDHRKQNFDCEVTNMQLDKGDTQ